MKINFDDFLNEKNTLTIEDSMDEFDAQEVKWELKYDISDLWNKYSKNKNVNKFIKNYKKRLLEKKDNLISINKSCWNELVGLVKENKTEEKDILPYLDKIYDWADKYGIEIITKSGNKIAL